ncbi:MAG: hypothetical protein JNK02_05205 [Planctomycetes bacterium]|nr:hypothetical protein [Planctomycetota bacterium]
MRERSGPCGAQQVGTAGRGGAAGAGLAVLAAGLGTLCAALVALAAAEPPLPPPGEVVVWAADRDGARVHGLDRDLRLARRIAVDWPLDVEPAHDGGLWVLRSAAGTSSSTHRLDRFDAHGLLLTELWLEQGADLDVLGSGEEALVVERRSGAPTRLLRVRTEGSLFPVLERDALRCVLGERETAVVGAADGTLLRVHAQTGAVQASASLGGSLADLAPGPAVGEVWVLDDAGPARLLLLDAGLGVRWSVTLPRPAGHLAPVPGAERVWIASTSAPCAARYGPGGALEVERCGLPLPGLDRALAWREGALLAAGGAILRLDRAGELAPGQGGFELVVDLAPRARLR